MHEPRAALASLHFDALGRRSGAASPDRMQSGAGDVNQMFTFSLPAVREASFKWRVTYNFEARLLVIPAPGFSLSG